MPTADSTRRDWLWRAGWRASGPSKISRASLAGVIPPTSAAGSLVVSFTPVRHRSPVVTRIVSGSAWSARPTNTNLHAVDGCPPRRPGSGPGAAPTRSLDAYRASLRGRATRSGPPGPLSQFLSHSPPSGAVRRCSPDRVCAVRGRWRTPAIAGQHCWKACWGQPLRSSNLLSSAMLDLRKRDCPAP